MPHNVVIKNCASLNTCTLKIGRVDGERSGNFLYANSLGTKRDNHCLIDKELVNEIVI